jgi:hypothetical protein
LWLVRKSKSGQRGDDHVESIAGLAAVGHGSG